MHYNGERERESPWSGKNLSWLIVSEWRSAVRSHEWAVVEGKTDETFCGKLWLIFIFFLQMQEELKKVLVECGPNWSAPFGFEVQLMHHDKLCARPFWK